MEAQLYKVLIEELSDGLAGSGSQKLNGHGRVVLKNGAVYEGNWVNGCMHGAGKLVFPDGIEYDGDFDNNTMTGTGVYRWPAWPGKLGSSTYQGEALDGKRHGQGTMSFADSDAVYTGQWAQGLRHGQGTLSFNKGGSHRYEGHWEHDMKQGYGEMRYANGDVYEGEWLRDTKCGHGKMSWKSSKQEYTGQWRDNMPNGLGTHVWFQQVSEKTDANHALLLMYNRYHGHFLNGQRSGYGIMYYATGARFEGQWVADKKEGLGHFVFENGDTWTGQFSEDRPVLEEGEQFAPKQINVVMYISDLVEEEEVPAATLRAINNVAMVYNSDLRSLYDLYCKRPSIHLKGGGPSVSHTLQVAQFWELMIDARLLSSFTPLSKMSQLLAVARRPPQALRDFQQQMSSQLLDPSNPDDQQFWDHLLQDTAQSGAHDPQGEVLFPAFCESLVRIAAVRYRHLPGLERRLHSLITTHLLGLVSKTKHTPPPRTAMHQELWSSEAVLQLLQELQPSLQNVFAHIASAPSTATQVAQPDEQAASTSSPEVDVYTLQSTVRSVVKVFSDLGVLPDSAAALAAARALCSEYLAANVYGATGRVVRQGFSSPGAADDAAASAPAPDADAAPEDAAQGSEPQAIDEAEEREIMGWLDMPVIYPEFLEGVLRLAHQAPWVADGDLAAKLRAMLQDDATGLLPALERKMQPQTEALPQVEAQEPSAA